MKFSRLAAIIIIWELFVWFICNRTLFDNMTWILFNEKEIYENIYLNGLFFNINSYIFVLVIVIVILTEYYVTDEKEVIITRYPSRTIFVKRRMDRLFVVAVTYTIIHFGMPFLASLVLFEEKYIFTSKNAMYYAASIMMFIFFVFQISLIYIMIRDVVQKKTVAMLLCVCLFILELILCARLPETIWFPCKDTDMGKYMYMRNTDYLSLISAAARQTLVTMTIIAIDNNIFLKKDVLSIEK